MARSAFERVIELQLERFSPEAARRKHIEIARRGLAEFMARQKERPQYRIEVDGHPATSEDQVRPYGVIVYRFFRMPQVARFAINTARDLSPVASGRYKKSWFLIADGKEIAEGAVPETVRSLILTNDQPYSRKIQVRGARLRGVPPGIVEKVRQLVLRRFGGVVTANIEFLTLKSGHVLQRDGTRVRRNGTRSVRKLKGQNLTYPALVLTPRV